MSNTRQKSPIAAQYELAGGNDFDWTVLPSAENGRRWTASAKSYVVLALQLGKVTREDLIARYPDLSDQEISLWSMRHHRDGQDGLRVTRIQAYDDRHRRTAQGTLDLEAK